MKNAISLPRPLAVEEIVVRDPGQNLIESFVECAGCVMVPPECNAGRIAHRAFRR